MIKYFKMISKTDDSVIGVGKWETGDAINYNPTNNYTVEDINETNYNTLLTKSITDTEENAKDINNAPDMLKALALVVADLTGKTQQEIKTLIKDKL